MYEWIKALHIIAVISWMAGMLYLPRLFVYHCAAPAGSPQSETFKVMERRLLGITHIGGALALVFGAWTLALAPAYLQQGWLHAKLAFVLGLVGYHILLVRLTRQFGRDHITRTSRWLRVFNEIPALLLIAIAILAVVKPA